MRSLNKPVKAVASARTRRRQRGFTLLEMMVALAIAGAIATMAYQGLVAASNGAERSREIMARVNELDRAWQIISADFRHILAPDVGPTGLRFRFSSEPLAGRGDDEQRLLLFSRQAWFNPLGRLRSDLQEVSYRIEGDQLWRDYRPVRNRPFDEYDFEEQALSQSLLTGVEDIEIRFLSARLLQRSGASALDGDDFARDWALGWPDPNQMGGGSETELPLAVLVRIEIEGVGVSERLFEIARF